MTHHTLDQWFTFLKQLITLGAPLVAAVLSFFASKRASEASQHAASAADAAEALSDHPALAVPAAGNPGVSLPQILRFWGFLSAFIPVFTGVRGAPVGQRSVLPLIKTKIDGRRADIETAITFRD